MKHFIFILLILLFSCSSNKKDENPIAKVGNSFLYPSDILGDDYTTEDEKQISETQIDAWINNELWYNTAKKELDNTSDIEEKVKEYEKNLYIAAYKESFLKENTIAVGDDEIVKYFKENRDKFQNLDDLYKVEFVKLDSKISNIDEIIESLNRNQENVLVSEVCTQQPTDCMLNPVWITEDAFQEVGLPEYLWVVKVKFQSFYINDEKILLYRITDKRTKGELMPLELASSEIISILEFQKAKKILQKKEKDLFLNNQKNNEIEIYK